MTAPSPSPRRSVVLTRPVAEMAPWRDALTAHGWPVVECPLIDIAPVSDATPLKHAAQAWAAGHYRAAMFVSGAAVRHFFAAASWSPVETAKNAMNLIAWCTGPGTTRALLAAGVPDRRIVRPAHDAAQFDSENLWALVGHTLQAGERVLIVRGGEADGVPSGRNWLAGQLRQAGAVVEEVAAYRRQPPVWDAAQRSDAAALGGDGVIWLFSSSQAIDHLQALLPGADWRGTAALCTHARIADAARHAGFHPVVDCPPGVPQVLASIESMA